MENLLCPSLKREITVLGDIGICNGEKRLYVLELLNGLEVLTIFGKMGHEVDVRVVVRYSPLDSNSACCTVERVHDPVHFL